MADKNSSASGIEKVQAALKPLLEVTENNIKTAFATEISHLQLAINELKVNLSTIEKMFANASLTGVKTPKKNNNNNVANGTTEGTNGSPVVKAPETASPGSNKLVYFRNMFKTNADFRAKYVDADVQKLLDAKEELKTKKGDQLYIAQSTLVWSYLKENKKEAFQAIENEFNDLKKKYEAGNKPPQQTEEAGTPEAK